MVDRTRRRKTIKCKHTSDDQTPNSRRGPGVVVHERELPEAFPLDVRSADLHLFRLPGERDEALQDTLLDDVEVVPLLVLTKEKSQTVATRQQN